MHPRSADAADTELWGDVVIDERPDPVPVSDQFHRAAAPRHVESVRRHFVDLSTDEQIDALGDMTSTVVHHLCEIRTIDEQTTDEDTRGAG